MNRCCASHLSHFLSASIVSIALMILPNNLAVAQGVRGKIVGGYFEEWSIYGANYNVANLQNNGVARKITHLLYAFGNVAPSSGAPDAQCHLADSWADYQDPFLPSVSGAPYTVWP